MDAEVGDLILCPVCYQQLNNPKFVPCHHTICSVCIEKLCEVHPGRLFSCPLCRSRFNLPNSDRLPTNPFAEELVRVKQYVLELEINIGLVRNDLAEANDARQKAENEKCILDMTLEEKSSQLDQLEQRSTQVEERLEAQVKELNTNLFAAEVNEISICEQLREITALLKHAEWQAETYQQAKNVAEASLAVEKELCNSLQQQLQQMHIDTSEQLRDAELRRHKAEIDAETWQRARNSAETSMEIEKESCRNLAQQLQQLLQRSSEQLNDAERRIREAEIETATCRKAKGDAEASLATAKQSCLSLQQQLEQTQRATREQKQMLKTELAQSKAEIISLKDQLKNRLALDEQQDYRKSYTEGWTITCSDIVCRWL